MTQPPRPGPAGPGDAEPTREITVPPGPPPAPDAETAPEADAIPVQADQQPTARLAAPEPAPPGRRSRTPYVLAALVALIVAAGVVAVLVYGG